MRTPVIAGNWKMHNTVAESLKLVRELKALVLGVGGVEIVVAPVFTALGAVAAEIKGSNIALSSQNVFWEEKGAYTGEIAPGMLKDVGCTYAIIGHSERRQYFGETDETVNKRVKATLKAGLTPIMCVGETLAEREGGKTLEIVSRQVTGGLAGLSSAEIDKLIIAYEPVWAIGTGLTPTLADVAEAHGFIRGRLATRHGEGNRLVRVLYGGSVKPSNASELMAVADVDGALVGGASLKAEEFLAIAGAYRGGRS